MIRAIKTDQIVYFGRILNTRFRGLHVASQNTLQISKVQHSNWVEHSGEKVKKKKPSQKLGEILITLFAHISPQALQRDLGPAGPRRIAGVSFSLMPQFWQLQKDTWTLLYEVEGKKRGKEKNPKVVSSVLKLVSSDLKQQEVKRNRRMEKKLTFFLVDYRPGFWLEENHSLEKLMLPHQD